MYKIQTHILHTIYTHWTHNMHIKHALYTAHTWAYYLCASALAALCLRYSLTGFVCVKDNIVRINSSNWCHCVEQVYLGHNHNIAYALRASVAERGKVNKIIFVYIFAKRTYTICVIFWYCIPTKILLVCVMIIVVWTGLYCSGLVSEELKGVVWVEEYVCIEELCVC